VVARLDQALSTLSQDEEMKKRVNGIGVTPLFENRQAFTAFVEADVKRNAALLSASGFLPE
jgi:tripartite-type tricarboxylate transporter receptor subunit TctC